MNESSKCAERINSFITTACLLLGLASPLVVNHMIYRHSPNTGSTHNRPSLLQTQWTSHRRRPLERQPQTISSWLERVTCTAQAPNPGVPTLDGNTRTMEHLRNRLKNPAPALKTNRQGYKKACDLFVRGGDGPFIKWNEI
jgi:hypothetical protein